MRKIIHIDMDAFFASVEQRDNPELRGRALAVGGSPDKRGVVATASYEARRYGIKSAMPMATAVRRCHQLIIISPRLSHYRVIAEQIRRIFSRFTDKIEPLSIDEAYLDVSDSDDFGGSATLLAEHIVRTIYQETGLTASAGVSYCKFLAKYAANINKPNGVFTVTPQQALNIIGKMPVEKFHGIGPATQKKLNNLGIFTGQDLYHADITILRKQLGKTADFYYHLAHGKDERPVRTSRQRQSLGNESTFVNDLTDRAEMQQALKKMVDKTWHNCTEKQLLPSCITVKIKYRDFSLHTKSYTQMPHNTPILSLNSAQLIATALLEQASPAQPVRLLGVSFSHFINRRLYPVQQRLFD
ncbi:MAG: DNA polymerase IV [Gammaproteobacteria bacterium]|nr:MAG: DNA polymerase IV [Gammaproteobacteria bacterium]